MTVRTVLIASAAIVSSAFWASPLAAQTAQITGRVPAQFTYGNSASNVVMSRGFANVDFVVMRYFSITERTRVQFRTEMFHATNTPAFGSPMIF
jgi:hypothetical protein